MSNFLNNIGMEMLEKKLDAVWMRQQVIAGNIANAATPGYKSNRLEFEGLLKTRLSQTDQSEDAIREALGEVEPVIVKQTGTAEKEDGNNVDEDYESIEMARALLEYSYLCNSLNSQINRMKYVVTEGRG